MSSYVRYILGCPVIPGGKKRQRDEYDNSFGDEESHRGRRKKRKICTSVFDSDVALESVE